MQKVVNHIIQLQELYLIRDEQKIVAKAMPKGKKTDQHLQQLEGSIKTMTAELPKDVKTNFQKLCNKDCIVISPVFDGSCAVCGMKLAISHAQAVRMGKNILNCPNCARMLYHPESIPRRKAERRSYTGPRKVGVSRFSSHSLMIPRLESTDREGVIRELAYKMEHEGFVDKADVLVESSLRREAVLGTAVDHGLAFPHVRGVEGGGLALALGISKKGIKFGGTGSPLSHVFFFIAIPTAVSAFYLKLLAGLTETFMKADARKAIMAESDPEKLWKVLCKVTRATIK